MKKTAFALAIVSGLIVSLVRGVQFADVVEANPYAERESDMIRAPNLAYPSIVVTSPQKNNTLLNSDSLTIAFTASIEFGWDDVPSIEKGGFDSSIGYFWSGSWIKAIYYRQSWQSNEVNMSLKDNVIGDTTGNYSKTIDLTSIPEGNHSVMITAYAHCCYPGIVNVPVQYPWESPETPMCYYFDSATSYVLGFSVDTISPIVSVLDLDSKTFAESEIPLSFTVNAADTRIAYSLDGQENITITGNITLASLAEGNHNLTVYVMDEAGNTGSQTVHFTVTFFPTELVLAPVLSVVAVSTGLYVYFKKRKH